MSGVPVEREEVPALATWTATFKAVNAGERTASVSIISSVPVVVDAVPQALEEGAGGDVKA